MARTTPNIISLNPFSAIGLVQMIPRQAYVTGPTLDYMVDKENTKYE